MLEEALQSGTAEIALEDLFTENELRESVETVHIFNDEYSQIHYLDSLDAVITVGAGLLSATIGILLVGIPKKTSAGMAAGSLADYIRGYIENTLTPGQVKALEKASMVPYDASVNKGFTEKRVEGLYPGMHRFYSVCHDPLFGLVVGISDIITGQMTTIDKNGHVSVQVY